MLCRRQSVVSWRYDKNRANANLVNPYTQNDYITRILSDSQLKQCESFLAHTTSG